MTSLLLLLSIVICVTTAPVDKTSTAEESNDVALPKRLTKKLEDTKEPEQAESIKLKSQLQPKNSKVPKKGRLHKAFFLNYPYVPQVPRYPTIPTYDENYNDLMEERASGQRKKYNQESDIFYIRLPPTPYFFVPGLGYISNPPKYTTASLRPQLSHVKPQRPQRPPTYQQQKPFINLPIDFVSNGKPTSVYQYENTRKPSKKKDTALSKLRKGPYAFNGRPTSIYLLGPDGEAKMRQPIIYSDLNSNNIL